MQRRYPLSLRFVANAIDADEELAADRARTEAQSRPDVIEARRQATIAYAKARARERDQARRTYSANDVEIARVAKAISHPARVKILRLLDQPEALSCDEIVRHTPLAQATVSQHLKVLKLAGLIKARRDSLRVYYSLAPQPLLGAKELLQRL